MSGLGRLGSSSAAAIVVNDSASAAFPGLTGGGKGSLHPSSRASSLADKLLGAAAGRELPGVVQVGGGAALEAGD